MVFIGFTKIFSNFGQVTGHTHYLFTYLRKPVCVIFDIFFLLFVYVFVILLHAFNVSGMESVGIINYPFLITFVAQFNLFIKLIFLINAYFFSRAYEKHILLPL